MGASFGQWLKLRRKGVGLSQQELADYVGCSTALIRKIEADERRSSRQIAELLIQRLSTPDDDPDALLRVARARAAHVRVDLLGEDILPSLEPLNPLTKRESEILALLAADLPDSAI